MGSSWDATDPFARARQADGVLDAEFQGERIPLILRHDDVRAAAADYRTYSSDAPFRVPIPSEEGVRGVRQLPIETDPPEHTDYRELVLAMFLVQRRPEMATQVRELVASMLASIVGGEPVEIVNDFALPLQSRALALLLKMPLAQAEDWIRWGTHVFVAAQGHSAEKGDELTRYLDRQFERAQAGEGDDFFSVLSRATFRGRSLTRAEKVGFANLVFAGGRDTVISAVAVALAQFAEQPQALQSIREEPARVRLAAEEVVRFASPLTMIGRVCPHDTNVHGVPVAGGDRAAICWASANHDETVFERPDVFDIRRKRIPHVAYGAGVHICLGQYHARLLLRTLIGELATSVGALEVLDSVARIEQSTAYRRQTGYESLTMRLTSRS